MENLISVLKTVLPIIIAFAMGYIAKRKQIVSRSGVSDMKKFVLNITLPVSLFGIFYKAAYSEGVIVCAIVFFAVSCVGLFVGKLLCKLTREKQPLYGFMTSAFEISLLGFALYTMVFGAEHVGSMAMLDIGNEIFIVTIYAALLRSSAA